MTKYVEAVWLQVLDAAKEFNGKPFAPIDIIKKIREKSPDVKANTIRCQIYGMTPNHPSNKYYPSKHTNFDFLGNRQFQMLKMNEITREEPKRDTIELEVNMAE